MLDLLPTEVFSNIWRRNGQVSIQKLKAWEKADEADRLEQMVMYCTNNVLVAQYDFDYQWELHTRRCDCLQEDLCPEYKYVELEDQDYERIISKLPCIAHIYMQHEYAELVLGNIVNPKAIISIQTEGGMFKGGGHVFVNLEEFNGCLSDGFETFYCFAPNIKYYDASFFTEMKSIHSNIQFLQGLKKLDLTYTCVKDIPVLDRPLMNLEVLAVSDRLRCLQGIDKFAPRLKELNVSNIQCKLLHPDVCNLPYLEKLWVFCNAVELPVTDKPLMNLRELSVGNYIRSLERIDKFAPNLVYLNLRMNKNLKRLHMDVSKLECLEALDISYTICKQLVYLPRVERLYTQHSGIYNMMLRADVKAHYAPRLQTYID